MIKYLYIVFLLLISNFGLAQNKNKLWASFSGHRDLYFLSNDDGEPSETTRLTHRNNFSFIYERHLLTTKNELNLALYAKGRRSFVGGYSYSWSTPFGVFGADIFTYGGGVNIRKELLLQEQVTFAVSNSTAIMHIRDDYLSRTPWKNMLENSLNAEAFFEMSPKMDLSLRLSYSFWFDTKYPEPYQNMRVSNPLTFSLGIGF